MYKLFYIKYSEDNLETFDQIPSTNGIYTWHLKHLESILVRVTELTNGHLEVLAISGEMVTEKDLPL